MSLGEMDWRRGRDTTVVLSKVNGKHAASQILLPLVTPRRHGCGDVTRALREWQQRGLGGWTCDEREVQ